MFTLKLKTCSGLHYYFFSLTLLLKDLFGKYFSIRLLVISCVLVIWTYCLYLLPGHLASSYQFILFCDYVACNTDVNSLQNKELFFPL